MVGCGERRRERTCPNQVKSICSKSPIYLKTQGLALIHSRGINTKPIVTSTPESTVPRRQQPAGVCQQLIHNTQGALRKRNEPCESHMILRATPPFGYAFQRAAGFANSSVRKRIGERSGLPARRNSSEDHGNEWPPERQGERRRIHVALNRWTRLHRGGSETRDSGRRREARGTARRRSMVARQRRGGRRSTHPKTFLHILFGGGGAGCGTTRRIS